LSRRQWQGSGHRPDQRSANPSSYRMCVSDELYNSIEETTYLAELAETSSLVVAVDGVNVGFIVCVKIIANGVLEWASVRARNV